MSERMVERELKSTIGYLGKYYGPGKVKVPLGLAKQLGPVSRSETEVPQNDLKPETPESRKERLAQLEAEVEQLRAEVAADEEKAAKEQGDGDQPEDDDDSSAGDAEAGTPLPEEFVNRAVRELLVTNGFTTVEKVEAATDEQLIALDGIAEGRLKEIRDAVTALKTSQTQD